MRLFLYYVSHSLFNTIKKLMKTWVAFIIIAMVFGLVVGLVTSIVGIASCLFLFFIIGLALLIARKM